MVKRTVRDRILSKIEIDLESECWVWTGSKWPNGYGQIHIDGRTWLTHRAAYTEWIGPIPEGAVLDHFKCERPACCNPEHVRPASQRENLLRGDTIVARAAAVTACPAGHAYDATNTYRKPNGKRDCRACGREKARRRYVPRERKPATHCRRGHELSGRNLYVYPSGNKRGCRKCHAAYELARYHRVREAAA